MECELNGKKLKYEDGKLYGWREMWGDKIVKVPKWVELKGSIKGDGYRQVEINKHKFQYHRVVYYIHNQEWNIHNSSTDNSIDHIDRNISNNNIENLRVVSHSQNQWNRNAKGYTFDKANGKYLARISLNGFIHHLGFFTNEDDARDAYLNAKEKYHSF